MNFSRQENHRVYFQRYLPPATTALSPLSFASSSANQESDDKEHRLVTSSAAIRLTAAATAEHVTKLLRKKFGLDDEQSPTPPKSASSSRNNSNYRKKSQQSNSRYFTGDALIIVGTLHNLPRQHLEYHHEDRLRKRHLLPPRPMQPSSNSNNSPMASSSDTVTTADVSSISSSHSMTTQSTPSIQTKINPTSFDAMKNTATSYPTDKHPMTTEEQAENINVIRTLLPHENPLSVRDEMLAHLYQRQFEFQPPPQDSPLQHQPSGHTSKTHSRLQKVEQMLQLQRQRGKHTLPTPANPPPTTNKKKNRQAVNVTIRWFFQSNGGGRYDVCSTEKPKFASSNNPIADNKISPTVLNLDGYFSAMEESDDESEEEDDFEMKENEKYGNHEIPLKEPSKPLHLIDSKEWNSDDFYYERFGCAPHLSQEILSTIDTNFTSPSDKKEPSSISSSSSFSNQHTPSIESYSRYLSNEVKQRYHLNIVQSPSSNNYCASGFLLKRSTKDPNVWRRVYCTVSDDQFWFVSRIRPVSSFSMGNIPKRFAKHCSIRLSNASISDPMEKLFKSSNKQPNKPRLSSSGPIHLLQITCPKGNAYTFCAPSRKAQKYWKKALSSRIKTCAENKWMEFAELIVEEEEDARTNRMRDNALTQCWERIQESNTLKIQKEEQEEEKMEGNWHSMILGQKWYHPKSVTNDDTWWWKEVTRISMLIQEYREVCRHFISYGRFYTGNIDPVEKLSVERWRFHTRIQWEAAAAVCLSKCYSKISLCGEKRNENGNAFYHYDGGQLGEIGANIEEFVYNNLRNVNSKHVKDILMVEAPPIDLFDPIITKVLALHIDQIPMSNSSVDKENGIAHAGNQTHQ